MSMPMEETGETPQGDPLVSLLQMASQAADAINQLGNALAQMHQAQNPQPGPGPGGPGGPPGGGAIDQAIQQRMMQQGG